MARLSALNIRDGAVVFLAQRAGKTNGQALLRTRLLKSARRDLGWHWTTCGKLKLGRLVELAYAKNISVQDYIEELRDDTTCTSDCENNPFGEHMLQCATTATTGRWRSRAPACQAKWDSGLARPDPAWATTSDMSVMTSQVPAKGVLHLWWGLDFGDNDEFEPGDRIGCTLDLDIGSLHFHRNGLPCKTAFKSGVKGPLLRTRHGSWAQGCGDCIARCSRRVPVVPDGELLKRKNAIRKQHSCDSATDAGSD